MSKRNGQSTAMLKVDNESKALFLRIKESLRIDESSEALLFICKEYIKLKVELKDIAKALDELTELQEKFLKDIK